MKRKKFTKLVTICIDTLTFERVRAVTDRLGVSVSEWFRLAVREKLEREGK